MPTMPPWAAQFSLSKCTNIASCALSWCMRLVSLSVLGTPVKVGLLVISLVLASFRPVLGAVDRSRGRGGGGAPAAQRGRTTLRPERIRRILGRRRDEAKTRRFKSCLPPVSENVGAGDALGRAGAQPDPKTDGEWAGRSHPAEPGHAVLVWVWDHAAASLMTALPSRITMCWPVSAC